MDSSKFQSVKVNIAFRKTLSDAPKVAVKDESLNKCSEFYGFLHLIHPAQAIRGFLHLIHPAQAIRFHRGYLLTEHDKVETRERLDWLMVGYVLVYLSACFLS